MTDLDIFACVALHALIINVGQDVIKNEKHREIEIPKDTITKIAYDWAGAMVKEHDKRFMKHDRRGPQLD